jgi:Tfp pilus assembly protein PilN
MININFVPEDYVQSSEFRRTNLMYMVLLVLVMAVLFGSFLTIKLRQRALNTEEQKINTKLLQAKSSLDKFEELQIKRKAMMKTALTTAELLEPIPRSVLLASLTNNLPSGVSLVKLKFLQKEPKNNTAGGAAKANASKYQAAQNAAASAAAGAPETPKEKTMLTDISIEGIAPSDLQVAAYIEQLSVSNLLEDVSLVESKEYKLSDSVLRQFKLTASLRKDVQLSNDVIEKIRAKGQDVGRVF